MVSNGSTAANNYTTLDQRYHADDCTSAHNGHDGCNGHDGHDGHDGHTTAIQRPIRRPVDVAPT